MDDNIKQKLKCASVWTEFKWLKLTFLSVTLLKIQLK